MNQLSFLGGTILHDQTLWFLKQCLPQAEFSKTYKLWDKHRYFSFLHWLVVSTPVKNMVCCWGYHSQYMRRHQNQFLIFGTKI